MFESDFLNIIRELKFDFYLKTIILMVREYL